MLNWILPNSDSASDCNPVEVEQDIPHHVGPLGYDMYHHMGDMGMGQCLDFSIFFGINVQRYPHPFGVHSHRGCQVTGLGLAGGLDGILSQVGGRWASWLIQQEL